MNKKTIFKIKYILFYFNHLSNTVILKRQLIEIIIILYFI